MADTKRVPISPEKAAKVLFSSDRTCCVCRQKGKSVQIHHIDDNPANNEISNFAVLCFDCHNETQIAGGFNRKLDAEQIILYRDDWYRIVARNRAKDVDFNAENKDNSFIELYTSIAEIYRENEQYELLAIHYDQLGNYELRDKYIEMALSKDSSDSNIIWLRALQKRRDLIPQEVIERAIKIKMERQDWDQLARLYIDIGDYVKAAEYYLKGVLESLNKGNIFPAAYYLKELVDNGIITALFEKAYKDTVADGDLWWQIRVLQELGWHSELRELLLKNKEQITKSDNTILQSLLAKAMGNKELHIQLEKEIAKGTKLAIFGDEEDEVASGSSSEKAEST